MHIVGTAGHVDHGKSSLVAALTGTNPDRWIEEQLRGMTLDLGFAHLRFEDGTQAGIVDVPGHERFLHNMLAGAAGMELLLLVIAADEGVMPQTIEHLQILRYLNVARTIVAITKADLLSPDDLEFAVASIAEELQGTLAAGAPCVTVSTRTGAGMQALRSQIHEALRSLPPRDPDAPAYLPIDRVFALPGRGTIVTGTLMQGTIAVGDTVKLEPSAKRLRVRSLQTFGQPQQRASGGARVAVNLPGVEVREIARGEVLADPQFTASEHLRVRFEPLPEAAPLLRRRNPVRAYLGAAEILGTLVLPSLPAGGQALDGQLFLRRPTVAYPGIAFVVRRMSPKTLLGGGRVIAASESVAPQAGEEGRDPQTERVLAALRGRGLSPAAVDTLAREVNLRDEAVEAALAALGESAEVLQVQRPTAYLAAGVAAAFLERALAELERQHRTEPWAMGVTSVALSRALGVEEKLLVRVLGAYVEEGRLANRGGYYATLEHVPRFSEEQRAFFDRLVPVDPAAPFAPAALAEVLDQVKQTRIAGAAKAFDTLLAKGALVKIDESLYRGTQIAQIHAKVEAFLRAEGRMTMAQFRDLIGTSRKYAVPLLEWFDARAVTVRSGDYRMLRAKREP